MNVCIITYSKTGNTYEVGKQIRDKLLASGHSVNLIRINPETDINLKQWELQQSDLEKTYKYDFYIIGSPVEAFSLNSDMKNVASEFSFLKNKEIACFVTKALPFNWTGGNLALSQLTKICQAQEAVVKESGIVKWRERTRENDITNLVNRFANMLS